MTSARWTFPTSSPRSTSPPPTTDHSSPYSATAYDTYGRELTETDANGHVTTTVYTPTTGATPTSIKVTQPKVTGQTAGFTTTTTLDPARGLDLKITDAAGYSTTSTYDPLGRLTAVWNPGFPTDNNPNTKFSYDLNPTLRRRSPPRPSTTTTPTAPPSRSTTRCCARARHRRPPWTAAAPSPTPSTTPTAGR
ncbi:hypothetical protein [Streptomyces mirabilis]